MAIRKFRSVEEMDGYHWYEPGDPVLFRAIRRVWELGYRTIRPRFPAGVHKHRSLTSKNALQESWADANFSAYQQRLREEMTRLEAGVSHPPDLQGGVRLGRVNALATR